MVSGVPADPEVAGVVLLTLGDGDWLVPFTVIGSVGGGVEVDAVIMSFGE